MSDTFPCCFVECLDWNNGSEYLRQTHTLRGTTISENFARFLEWELKHGCVALLATIGMITPGHLFQWNDDSLTAVKVIESLTLSQASVAPRTNIFKGTVQNTVCARQEGLGSSVGAAVNGSQTNGTGIKQRKTPTHSLIAVAKDSVWTVPNTGIDLFYRDTCEYSGYDRTELGFHTLTGVGQYI